MENVLINLNTHYGSIIVQCTSLERAYMYKKALVSLRFALLDFLNMFRYNKNQNFHNPRFYRSIQRQLLDVDIYIKEVEEVIVKLKAN